ncbi:MAG: HU family DNA-binding protein [Spirochaetes bacterium]|nr:HU family DNA-binding protein [Spirochaetota bacterium]
METAFERIPDYIKPHLQSVTKTSGLPDTRQSLEAISEAWLEKRRIFREQTKTLHMEEIDSIEAEDPRGALVLTYSGSLLGIGTISEQGRWAEYASIGLRKDVPDILTSDRATVAGPIEKNRPVEFENGPIKKSSPALIVAVTERGVPPAEQQKRIREAVSFLTNGFVKINRTLLMLTKTALDKYTMSSMVSYIAKKNNISRRCAKAVIDDFIDTVEQGVLSGARVPIGRLGRIFLKMRGPQKARIGRNPQTGEEITIAAKPRSLVPRISFGRAFKNRATVVRR